MLDISEDVLPSPAWPTTVAADHEDPSGLPTIVVTDPSGEDVVLFQGTSATASHDEQTEVLFLWKKKILVA